MDDIRKCEKCDAVMEYEEWSAYLHHNITEPGCDDFPGTDPEDIRNYTVCCKKCFLKYTNIIPVSDKCGSWCGRDYCSYMGNRCDDEICMSGDKERVDDYFKEIEEIERYESMEITERYEKDEREYYNNLIDGFGPFARREWYDHI